MAKATKKTAGRVTKATRLLSEATDAVFAAVGNTSTPFRECLAAASPAVRDAYSTALVEVIEAEREAINLGQAWRGSSGLLYLNTN